MDLFRELAPLPRIVRHEAHALQIVKSSARPAIEDVAAAAHDGSLEDDIMPSVFEDAVDQGAIDEMLVVQLHTLAFDDPATNDIQTGFSLAF